MWIQRQYLGLIAILALFITPSAAVMKRAPPFKPEGGNDAALPSKLGNYTHSHENIEEQSYTCTPIGECDVCLPFEKKTAPHCMEYGNKQPVRCVWDDPDLAENMRNQTTLYDDDAISLPSFRGCPHVKSIERWKFIKFESFNFVIAVMSVCLVMWRQRKLARDQYRRLAQRIGVAV